MIKHCCSFYKPTRIHSIKHREGTKKEKNKAINESKTLDCYLGQRIMRRQHGMFRSIGLRDHIVARQEVSVSL